MIRRDCTFDDGTPAWILISQIEHARIAGELATDWGNAEFDSLPLTEFVLPTVFHHDDGWLAWESNPTIDPVTGKPLAFTEMPNDIAHDIWRQSIESVRRWGPLAQYMVAEHFMRLRRGGDETHQADVREFLNEFDSKCQQWRNEFIHANELKDVSDLPELAVEYLQMFDRLSLYLCCTPPQRRYTLESPGGKELTVTFRHDEVVVAPWPWQTPEKEVSTGGFILKARPLESNEQLHEQLTAEATTLTWTLIPASL